MVRRYGNGKLGRQTVGHFNRLGIGCDDVGGLGGPGNWWDRGLGGVVQGHDILIGSGVPPR